MRFNPRKCNKWLYSEVPVPKRRMSSKPFIFFLSGVVGLFFVVHANAQISTDSIPDPHLFEQSADVYISSAAARGRIYSGPLYRGYDHHAQGHPFFMTDTLVAGSAFYDGILLAELRISYDLVKDVVVMRNERKDIVFQLIPEKLPWFTVAGRRFVYLTATDDPAGVRLQLHREFYSPAYETDNDSLRRLPDLRNVLYWSPDVTTDASGRYETSFYTSDMPGTYFVIVQGMTAGGKIGSWRTSFTVQ
jgi:hypothetical protein